MFICSSEAPVSVLGAGKWVLQVMLQDLDCSLTKLDHGHVSWFISIVFSNFSIYPESPFSIHSQRQWGRKVSFPDIFNLEWEETQGLKMFKCLMQLEKNHLIPYLQNIISYNRLEWLKCTESANTHRLKNKLTLMGFAISAENHKGFTCCDQPGKYRWASSAKNKSKGKFRYQTLIHVEMACFLFGVFWLRVRATARAKSASCYCRGPRLHHQHPTMLL